MTLDYNKLDNTITESYANNSESQLQLITAYNEDGKLHTISDYLGNETAYCKYNSLGQVTLYNQQKAAKSKVREAYSYNQYGDISQIKITGEVSQQYDYGYEDSYTRRCNSISFGNACTEIEYDTFGRTKDVSIKLDENGNCFGIRKFCSFRENNSNSDESITSNKVSTLTISYGDQRYNIKHEYSQSTGALEKVRTEPIDNETNNSFIVGKETKYTYNEGRLVREDNGLLGQSKQWRYDDNGNLEWRAVGDYQPDKQGTIAGTYYNYSYDGDKLTDCAGETCVYDNMGNPTTYRGKTATWKGRQMTSLGDNTFTYDGRGRRISKNDITYYFDSNGRVIKQSDGFEFFYGFEGVATCKYNGNTYIYVTDAFGNVIALVDNNKNIVVQYMYDAWGNHKVVDTNGNEITDQNHIGNLNPFRYRGYYYDRETGLYFLQTRYYDPEIGRFLNRDSVQYADPETINGLNLYVYCLNNPIAYVDPTGEVAWYEWLGLALISVLAVGFIVAGTILTGGMAAVGSAGLIGSVLSGIGTGFLSGASASIVLQGASNNWDFNKISPLKAIRSGVIGAMIGGICGIMSYSVGYLGSMFGSSIGHYISNITIKGLHVGKGFEYLGGTDMIVSLFSGLGSILGGVTGAYIANDGMNRLLGNNYTSSDNLSEAIQGELNGEIISLLYKFFRWLL